MKYMCSLFKNCLLVFFVTSTVTLSLDTLYGQEVINLNNPSFEDVPGPDHPPKGWYDCGHEAFPNESAPDVQPSGAWKVFKPAVDGRTYLGMVVRENNSWESVTQRLSAQLKKEKSYSFSIYICTSEVYLSGTAKNTQSLINYTTPAKLRIWGGNQFCEDDVLLAESPMITNNEWQKFTFTIKPLRNISYITLEAFYKTPMLTQDPYNGNILLDNASAFVEIVPKKTPPPPPPPKPSETITALKQKVTKGQVIRIDKLNFQADKATLNSQSHKILDEVVRFMNKNKNVKIEIGGHTNGVPSVEYCNKLSTERAKAVTDYLVSKGVHKSRVVSKGYGKSKPLESDKTLAGRNKNQRVEITILSI